MNEKGLLAILESPHTNGTTATLLNHAIRKAEEIGYNVTKIGYELTVRSLLSDIILYLFTLQHHIQKTTTEVDKRNESRFREMLQLIENRYYENITLKEIADAAFISKTECIRCFKSITGRTPIQYLREYRIQKAAELLI